MGGVVQKANVAQNPQVVFNKRSALATPTQTRDFLNGKYHQKPPGYVAPTITFTASSWEREELRIGSLKQNELFSFCQSHFKLTAKALLEELREEFSEAGKRAMMKKLLPHFKAMRAKTAQQKTETVQQTEAVQQSTIATAAGASQKQESQAVINVDK